MAAVPKVRANPIVIAAERERLAAEQIELGDIEAPAARIGVLPDEKHLVDCAQRIDLKLVVGIPAIDEHLHVVIEKYQRVALGLARLHEGLLDPESDI